MLLFALSIIALVAGPLLYRAAGKVGDSLSALDGFVMVAVSGLVVVHIIPHAMESAGLIAIGFACLGFFGPGLIESALHRAADRVHTVTLQLALLGLVLPRFF